MLATYTILESPQFANNKIVSVNLIQGDTTSLPKIISVVMKIG